MTVLTYPVSQADNFASRDEPASAETLLRAAITRDFPGRIALLSSFGAESAVLLHMVAGIDAATPVIFLDTGKLFPETLAYRLTLTAQLGLTNVTHAGPSPGRIAATDPDGLLWQRDPDLCCWNRKVEPTDEALAAFDAYITGRKRYHGGLRDALPMIETDDAGKTRLNPLVGWSRAQIDWYFAEHGLPQHPLVRRNYRSIGCAPCTRPTAVGEPVRAGRWAGTSKTECGIHLPHARHG